MRRVLVGLVTVFVAAGLVGCGDGEDAAGSGKDSAGRLRLPVGSSGGGGRASSDEAMANSKAGADAMIAPARAVEYRLAGDAEAPAKSAAAYRLTAKAGARADDATQIGKALRVDDLDGVEVQGGIGWYYGRGQEGQEGVVSSGTAVACTPEGKCPEPPAPAPPAGLPSAAQAERRFREILNDLGVDIGGGSVQVLPDTFDVRVVTFTPRVEGVEVVGLETSVAFGENGRVEYANGSLGRFERVGEYPLIGLPEALERFQEGFAFDGRDRAAAEGVPGDPEESAGSPPDAGPPDAGRSEPSTGCSTGETCVDPERPSEDEPTMTIEPQQPPVPLEPEIVEITGAELVLEVVYPMCEGGEVYLVPAYRLLPDATAGFTVTAVEDESLAVATQPGAGVSDDEPCPGDEPDDVPMGRPEPAPLPADDGREPSKP